MTGRWCVCGHTADSHEHYRPGDDCQHLRCTCTHYRPEDPMTEPDTRPYRIGWWTHQWWPSWWRVRTILSGWNPKTNRWYDEGMRLRLLREARRDLARFRRPHRPWQAEASELPIRFARRAFTAAGAEGKIRDDVRHLRATGQPSPWQRRHTARADRRTARREAVSRG